MRILTHPNFVIHLVCGAAIAAGGLTEPPQPDRANEAQRRAENPAQPTALAAMEGSWIVEVRMSDSCMRELGLDPGEAPAGRDEVNGAAERVAGPDLGALHTFYGVAEINNVLEDSVLRERLCLLPSGSVTQGDSASMRRTLGSSAVENEAMQSISYISVEPGEAYSAVMISDSGDINFEHGTYNATAKRIEFLVDPSSMTYSRRAGDPMRRDSNDWSNQPRNPAMPRTREPGAGDPGTTQPRDPSTPQTGEPGNREPGRNIPGMNDQRNGRRVVLEILGDGKIQVTMYAHPMARPAAPEQPRNGTDSNRTGQPANRDAVTASSGILYQATYTRADDTLLGDVRDFFFEQDHGQKAPEMRSSR